MQESITGILQMALDKSNPSKAEASPCGQWAILKDDFLNVYSRYFVSYLCQQCKTLFSAWSWYHPFSAWSRAAPNDNSEHTLPSDHWRCACTVTPFLALMSGTCFSITPKLIQCNRIRLFSFFFSFFLFWCRYIREKVEEHIGIADKSLLNFHTKQYIEIDIDVIDRQCQ